MTEQRVGRWAPVALTVANVLFRLPALLAARGLHSDAAIVGLQALHLLQGERSRFLWGTSYQGSFDAFVVAGLFAVGGPTPLMLMLAPLLGHLLLTLLAWRVLARRLEPLKAALLCSVLVFAPQAINTVALAPPRQWCLTFMFAALALLDLERPVTTALGVLTAGLALWMDLYGLQLVVPLLAFAALCCLGGERRVARAVALGVGVAAGALAVTVLRAPHHAFGSGMTRLDLSAEHVAANWRLFSGSCLPMALGAQVWKPELWTPPLAVRAWQGVGAVVLLLGIASAVPLAFARRVPWPVRRLGLFGAACAFVSCAGFLVSATPGDLWAQRYLAPIVWTAPFALAPLACVFTARGLVTAVLVPYVSVAAVAGWLTFAPYEDQHEDEVAAFLRARGVHHAVAPYWVSYRLTFLFREDPIVAELDGPGRYPPYREAFERAPVVAYIFHPSQPEVTAERVLPELRAQPGTVEVTRIAGFTVVIHHRG